MDFAGVLSICDSVLPLVGEPARSPWRRFSLVLAGSADAALGNYESASKRFVAVQDEMDHQMVIHDWYTRMMLESALTDLWLATADLAQARPQAERFLQVTLATPERTWQALAWDANARVALFESDIELVTQHGRLPPPRRAGIWTRSTVACFVDRARHQ
jgi:hypothetical protein